MKEPLTLDEQIEHLKINKKIIFNIISEDKAKRYLSIYGYSNLISAHKHNFHNGKINGKHVYNNPTDFKQYLDKYNEEQKIVKNILPKILKIENTLSTFVINEVLLKDKNNLINMGNDARKSYFLKELKKLLCNTKKSKLIDIYEKIEKEEKRTSNIYYALCTLTFSEILLLFSVLPASVQNKIFNSLKKENMSLGGTQSKEYINILYRVKDIRNYCAHNNSLEFLIRYKTPGRKTQRYIKDKKKYKKLILKLNNLCI